MSKVSVANIGNDYCPQTLFLYGTYKENGEPDFGLFCWFSYCWMDGLGVMASIGGSKLTLDHIRKTKVFSANLVTEGNLAFADRCGTISGYEGDKMSVHYEWEKGAVLDVPVLKSSPVAFELAVEKIIELDDKDNVVLLCKVKNQLMDELLTEEGLSPEEKLQRILPVSTTCMTYFGWNGGRLGQWHELSGKA